MMVMLLRKLGYEIEIASNGVEALKILEREAVKGREKEIECILMDASMDVMDGLECTRVIRQQQFPNRVRPYIVAATANATDEYRHLCLASGMDRFISKPVDVNELIKALKAAYQTHYSTQTHHQQQQPQSQSPHQRLQSQSDKNANSNGPSLPQAAPLISNH